MGSLSAAVESITRSESSCSGGGMIGLEPVASTSASNAISVTSPARSTLRLVGVRTRP